MPATALAAPPANDDRTKPEELGRLPAQVMGTTVEATRVPTDPSSACGLGGPQVWYRFTAPADGRIALRLVAEGDLDAILDAYLSERSQTTSLSCDPTDTQGIGAVDFDVKRGRRYLIAVSMLTNSVPGDFQLTVVAPQPPPRPPGTLLAKGSVDGTLDRVGNLEDAYSLRMRAGRTYRFRLSGRSAEECAISARLYPPGSRSFDGGAVKRLGCDASGYETFTPGPGDGGRYSILVSSARGTRALQRYHLERLRRTLGRGRYFVAVRALGGGKGSYKLTRTSKVLTHAHEHRLRRPSARDARRDAARRRARAALGRRAVHGHHPALRSAQRLAVSPPGTRPHGRRARLDQISAAGDRSLARARRTTERAARGRARAASPRF